MTSGLLRKEGDGRFRTGYNKALRKQVFDTNFTNVAIFDFNPIIWALLEALVMEIPLNAGLWHVDPEVGTAVWLCPSKSRVAPAAPPAENHPELIPLPNWFDSGSRIFPCSH
jgi:hypothetical protein